MKESEITALEAVFGGEDVLSVMDRCDYFDVIRDAFRIHVDRERIRNGLWKEYPAEDQVNQIKVKVDRIGRSLERLSDRSEGDLDSLGQSLKDNICEELYDIINYANFAVRKVKGLA